MVGHEFPRPRLLLFRKCSQNWLVTKVEHYEATVEIFNGTGI